MVNGTKPVHLFSLVFSIQSQSRPGHVIYLLKLGHPSNLFVNLLGILRADIGGNRNEGSLGIGTTSFVPIGTGCAELCGSQDVNTAVVTQQKILQIINH